MTEKILEVFLSVLFFGTIILIAALFYFIPSLIALKRNHKYKLWIFALNFLTGYSGLGWIASFVWAFIDNEIPKMPKLNLQLTKSSIAQEIKELAQLKDDGLITEDEFSARKSKILNE